MLGSGCSQRGVTEVIVLRVSDFTTEPGARYRDDGDYSGEWFREEALLPHFQRALDSHTKLVVDLDGTDGYATSFLEEAFGGLARIYPIDQVLSRVEVVSDEEPRWVDKIAGYIRNARGRRA